MTKTAVLFAKAVAQYTSTKGRYPGAIVVSHEDIIEACLDVTIRWEVTDGEGAWKFLDHTLFLDPGVPKGYAYGVKKLPVIKRKELE